MSTLRRDSEQELALAIAESLSQPPRHARRTSSQDLAEAIAASLDLAEAKHATNVSSGDHRAARTDDSSSGSMPAASAPPRHPHRRHHTDEDEELARKLQSQWMVEDRMEAPKSPKPEPSDDEDFALALELQLQEESTNTRTSTTSPQPANPALRAPNTNGGLCSTCGTRVSPADPGMAALGSVWHARCFRCALCGGMLSAGAVAAALGGGVAHVACAHAAAAAAAAAGAGAGGGMACDACGEALPREGRFIHFQRHSLFNERYCHWHLERDPSCCGCQRVDRRGKRTAQAFALLPDGRRRCHACSRTAVTVPRAVDDLFAHICDFFASNLGLAVSPAMRQVQVGLVDLGALNDSRAAAAGAPVSPGHHHHGFCDPRVPTTRGITLTETRVMHEVDWRGRKVPGTEIHEKTVTAVLVLEGLPHDCCGSILAHEAMHVWLAMQPGGRGMGLSGQVEEGICQLIAWLWLQQCNGSTGSSSSSGGGSSSGSSGGGSGGGSGGSSGGGGSSEPSDRALREFFVHQIEADTSAVYGQGFQAARRAYAALGLQPLLEHIMRYKTFPAH